MEKRIKVENIFWVGYFLVIFSDMFVNVKFIAKYTDIINVIGLMLLILYIIISNNKINKKDFYIMLVLFIMSIITYFYCKDFTILRFLILMYCMKNISFDYLVKNDFNIRLTLFILLSILSFLGACNITSFIRAEKIRYTLGFIHPNATGFFMMILTMEYLYINKDKINYKHFLVIILAMIAITYITDSRSSAVCLGILSIATLFIKFFRNSLLKSHIFCFIVKNFMLISTILSFAVAIAYSNNISWAISINNKLSNRIVYLSNAINTYDITLFGRILPQNIVLDNQYISFILNFGIVFAIIYYLLFYIKFDNLIKEKDAFTIIILMVLLIYGLMEKIVFRVPYNIFMLSLSTVIYNDKKKEEINDKQNSDYSTSI